MHHDITTENSGSHVYAVLNAMLFSFGWICNIVVNTINLTAIYDWTFKGLSLLSVTLIVVINWKKAWVVLTGKDKQQ